MNDFITFLGEYGFEKELKVNLLKITVTEPQKSDLRYSLDGEKLIGLHICGQEFEIDQWEIIMQGLNSVKDLQVLYLADTPLKLLKIDRLPSLNFINASDNGHLERIELSGLTNLTELHASFCPQLTKVSLKGTFNALKKMDVSNGQIRKLELPERVKELRSILAFKNPLEEIKWPKEFVKIELIRVDDGVITDDALNEIIKQTGDELLTSLNAYLSVLYPDSNSETLEKWKRTEDSITKLRRLKILFSGNTTIGKSTLRRIFMADRNIKSAAYKKEDSTTASKFSTKKLELIVKLFLSKDLILADKITITQHI
jgi:Leucine-rich repeat (LRR) protein